MKNSINALYFLVHAENYPKWASQPAGWLVYPLSEWVIWKKKLKSCSLWCQEHNFNNK